MKVLFLAAISLVMTNVVTATPTPPPSSLSNADIKKIPAAQIRDTLLSEEKLIRDTQAKNEEVQGLANDALKANTLAITVTGGALSKITELTGQILQVTSHDQKMTALANDYGKKLNWYRLHVFLGWIILGTGLIACGVVAFLKFTGRLAIAAAPVAAKVP